MSRLTDAQFAMLDALRERGPMTRLQLHRALGSGFATTLSALATRALVVVAAEVPETWRDRATQLIDITRDGHAAWCNEMRRVYAAGRS